MGSFYDYTSSNNYTNLYLQTDYTTTAYTGYTRVTANSYVVVKSGSWGFTTYKSSTNPQLSINGSTANLTQYEVKVGTAGNKYKVASNYVDIYHTTNKTITITSSINLGSITIVSTGGKVGSYSLSGEVTLVPKPTACSAPTSITASPNPFDSSVDVKWSGAGSGIGNTISGYRIGYYESTDGTTWLDSNWHYFSDTTSTSGTYDLSSVARGNYIKFGIQTKTSNSDYNSSWAYSNVVRRKPYTVCTAPTTFTVTPNNFDISITLSWSGAGAGTNNSINGYGIQYCLSDNNSTWDSWIDLQTISTTKTSHEFSVDISDKVSRGKYVKFRIRTQGSAGSSYYSAYKESSSIIRNPYSKCIAPTNITLGGVLSATSTVVISQSVYNLYLKIDWDAGEAGENLSLTGYQLEYQTSDDSLEWNDSWNVCSTVESVVTTNINADFIDRGKYIRFRIITLCDNEDYNSEPSSVSNIIERCTIPEIISDIKVSTSEFSNGEDFKLVWKHIQTKWTDNPIISYEVRGAYENDDSTMSTFSRVAKITVANDLSDGAEISLCFGNSSSANVGETVNGVLTTSTTMLSTFYSKILNEGYAQLYVVPYDSYNTNTSSEDNIIITINRYDRIGVAIGIDGKWIDCQIFVGSDGQWVEQQVSVGIDNQWVDTDDGT